MFPDRAGIFSHTPRTRGLPGCRGSPLYGSPQYLNFSSLWLHGSTFVVWLSFATPWPFNVLICVRPGGVAPRWVFRAWSPFLFFCAFSCCVSNSTTPALFPVCRFALSLCLSPYLPFTHRVPHRGPNLPCFSARDAFSASHLLVCPADCASNHPSPFQFRTSVLPKVFLMVHPTTFFKLVSSKVHVAMLGGPVVCFCESEAFKGPKLESFFSFPSGFLQKRRHSPEFFCFLQASFPPSHGSSQHWGPTALVAPQFAFLLLVLFPPPPFLFFFIFVTAESSCASLDCPCLKFRTVSRVGLPLR